MSRSEDAEIHKWFVAAVLFGTRIPERIAAETYREFERAGLLSPHRIIDAGWDKLVAILDRGGYARYDFKTATKLLEVNRTLVWEYKIAPMRYDLTRTAASHESFAKRDMFLLLQ